MLTLILGGMFSGKTTELLRRLERAKIAGKEVILLRPKSDTRGVLTHSRLSHNIEEMFVSELDLDHLKQYDVVGIDEGQFFNHDFVKNVNWLADARQVYISALNGTSERTPFNTIQQLVPHADYIDFKTAVCTRCGTDHAAFSYYKAGKKTEDIKVGDEGEYTALCRDCWNLMMS